MSKLIEHMTEPELREMLDECANTLEFRLSKHASGRPMFVILVFDDPKVAQYVSSCDRGTMVQALREAADRLEKRQDVQR